METVEAKSGERYFARSLLFVALAFLFATVIFIPIKPQPQLGWHLNLFLTQDLTVGIFFSFAIAATILAAHHKLFECNFLNALGGASFILAIAVIAITGGCAVWLLQGFPFSHDEFLLVEESRTFLSGRLAAPVPPEWRPFIGALQFYYVRVNPDATLMTTEYYPGSAAIYAMFAAISAEKFTNPVLAAGAVLLTAHLARGIFPDAPQMRFVAALLLAISPQFIVTAITPFAMTSHLFLNLAWLALFLRDKTSGHIGALIIGAIAIAQHQIHIHPLFALPFLLDLAFRRRAARLALAYFVVYAATASGCLAWRSFILDGPAVSFFADTADANGLDALFTRMSARLIEIRSLTEPLLWLGNFLRFSTWQNPVAIVLAIIGLLSIRRAPRPLRLLALGLPVSLVPYILFENNQGVGWGFRYLHVHLATISLLAVWAVIELRRRVQDDLSWQRVVASLVTLGAITAPLLLIWRVLDFSSVVLPYRAAAAEFERMDADVLITSIPGIVKNSFDFDSSTKIALLERLSDDQISQLCERFDVAILPPGLLESLGVKRLHFTMGEEYSAAADARAHARLAKAGCQ